MASVKDTNVGTAVQIDDASNCIVTVVGDIGSTTGDSITYKFMAASADDAPNFDSTAVETTTDGTGTTTRVSRFWDYVEVTDMDDGSTIDGVTGDTTAFITGAATNYSTATTGDPVYIATSTVGVKRYKINDIAAKWLNLEITTYTDASDGNYASSTLSAVANCKSN